MQLLKELERQPMAVNWDEIIQLQTVCLDNGVNGIGIPDLMIAQNAMQRGLRLFSNDKHFALISRYIALELFL